ncbi:MAG: DNA polymerase III subunit delta [Clostridia bacterium]|nr:DNA polymerase III subunit delta [Clostridia bacterium]
MKTLKARLQKKVESCYLIQGEDVLLYDKALELIKKANNLTLEEFNFIMFDEDSFNADTVINSCETLPMGSEKKVVLLKNISKFNENFKKKLRDYLKKPVESTCLVIFDFFNKFDFLISEKVSAKRLDDYSLKELIAAELKVHDKTITPDACQNLIESCCGYYSLIKNEIEKLISCDDFEIDSKIIDSFVCKETEFTVFELTDALSKRNAEKAVSLLNLMDKDTKTFSLILNHFRRLFFVSVSGMSDKELAEYLSVKEFAVVKARELSKNFTKLQLKNIYEMLNDVDFYIKNGQMQVENALYYLIFGILYC